MLAGSLLAVVREAVRIFGGVSVYLLAGMAGGSLAAAVAGALGGNAALWGLSGATLVAAPLYYVFSSDRAITARLRHYRTLQDERLITARQAADLREALVRWWMLRQFGRAGLERPPDEPPSPPPP